MITGEFSSWRKQAFLNTHPLWGKVFLWLEENLDQLAIGEYNLPFGDCLVRVMEYDLKTREVANYEAHNHTIDLQMSLERGEGIEWTPIYHLATKGEYRAKSDFQFYNTPHEKAGFVENTVGRFTLLFPEDGHQPQRLIRNFKSVKKLVVKIPTKSIE